MLGRISFVVALAVLMVMATPGDGGPYSHWHFESPDAYEACLDAPHRLTTDGWGQRYPWVDHEAFSEVESPVMVQRLFPREGGDTTNWQVGFMDGNTSIRADARGAQPLDLSMLDQIVANLGFTMDDLVFWSSEAMEHRIGRIDSTGGQQVWEEHVESWPSHEYRVASYPRFEAILDSAGSVSMGPHVVPHAGVHAWAGPWEWYLTVPDCIPDAEDGIWIGPDGHGWLDVAPGKYSSLEAFRFIQSAYGQSVTVTSVEHLPGMRPS